ncbi:ABC transporter-like domain protein, partial [mine drainage metagenome]
TTGTVRRRRLEVEAVRGISFRIAPGELFGLLGPNGAGKTTTIRVLCTLLLPTSGRVRVQGLDVVESAREVRRRIGYVFGGDRGLYDRLSALDNLRYFAELYAIEPRQQRARIGEVLAMVGLTGRERERGGGILERDAAAAAPGAGPAPRPAGALLRRAHDRGGPGRGQGGSPTGC